MIRLSGHQLFTLMLIFEIGSTTLFALGIEVEQDAWIVILIALLIGLCFVWIYTKLQNAFSGKNLVEIIMVLFGKILGIPLVIFYVCDCLWSVARSLREFGELLIITSLPKTPFYIILILFLLTSTYALFKGTEVLARASEIVVPIMIFFILISYILLILSKKLDFRNLLPVASSGISPMLKAVPGIVMFPFGEIFIFFMYWCYVDKREDIRKISMKAVLISGILIIISSIVNISALGCKYTYVSTIPFIESIKLINIGCIITNIDIIAILVILFGGFFKMSIYLNAIILILKSLFKTQKYKSILIIFDIFLIIFSLNFEKNYIYHKWMVPFDALYFEIIYTNIIPIIMLILYYIKKKRIRL